MWRRLEEGLPRIVEEAGRRSVEAEVLLVELLSYPHCQQVKVLLEPRFQSLGLLEHLLEESQEAQPRDLERSVALADLGGQLAARLLRHKGAEAECAMYSARASILSGNARRLEGKPADAEAAFGRAACFLAWRFESWDRAEFCRALGLLRWEQGRLDEAEALLQQAARSFAGQALPQEEGASSALLGLLHLEQGRPEVAIRFLERGRCGFEPGGRPWLTVRAGLSLALALAELGQADRACWVVQETWRHTANVRGERELVRLSWLEGRVWARAGRREEAEQLLTSVWLKFIAEYSLPEAALCSLDLAALLVEAGRETELPRLQHDLEETFSAEDAALEVIRQVSRHFAAATAGGKEVVHDCAAEAASTLRRAFRFRGYRVDPLPFA